MDAIQSELLDLVAMAETPLYSAYDWLGERFGAKLVMSEFLTMIATLMDRDFVKLWEVARGDRTELYEVPPRLEQRYREIGHEDGSFDPFSLSITVKESVRSIPPEWTFDCDFEKGAFVIRSAPSAVESALAHLARYFDSVHFEVMNREDEGASVVLRGTVSSISLG